MKHTREPWGVWKLAPESDFRELNILTTADGENEISGMFYIDADADRAAACVNALAGIENPAGFVKRQQEAVDELLTELGQALADRLLVEAELIETRSDKFIEAFERNSLRLAEANNAALTFSQDEITAIVEKHQALLDTVHSLYYDLTKGDRGYRELVRRAEQELQPFIDPAVIADMKAGQGDEDDA